MANEATAPLRGRVAVVAGATRGAGRGIAAALGEGDRRDHGLQRLSLPDLGVYDLAKVAVNRLAFSQGHELAPHGGTAIAVTPGFVRSEMTLDAFGVREDNWRDALAPRPEHFTAPPDFAPSESPRYVGRAVAAVAADPDRKRWNQQSLTSGSLAAEDGFTDVDGSRPDIWRYLELHDRGTAGPRDRYR